MDTELKIEESHASQWAKGLGLYNHPQELKAALREGQAQFLRTLRTIDPHYPWKVEPLVVESGFHWNADPVVVQFNCKGIRYKGEVANLNHPKTYLDERGGNLALVHKTHVAHCNIELHILVTCTYTQEEIMTLRSIGVMREVTERYYKPQTRTIVQCEI